MKKQILQIKDKEKRKGEKKGIEYNCQSGDSGH